MAMRSLAGLTPPNWKLEWYLPWWLADVFQLDADVGSELVLSNVLGLVSIRLQDDLVDGDVAETDVTDAHRLATLLFEQALAAYRSLLPSMSPLWAFVGRSMSEWRAGSSPDAPQLSSRAAPLRISAFGTCLLADRADTWPILDLCLDHALTGLVLYDQFCDWEHDLAAGRWNAFVAAVSPHEQRPADRERNRSAMLTAMMTGSGVRTHFQRIHAEASASAALARDIGSAPLAEHLSDFGRRTHEQGEAIQAHYQGAGVRARALIFGAGEASRITTEERGACLRAGFDVDLERT
jgi:hypothetical protein